MEIWFKVLLDPVQASTFLRRRLQAEELHWNATFGEHHLLEAGQRGFCTGSHGRFTEGAASGKKFIPALGQERRIAGSMWISLIAWAFER